LCWPSLFPSECSLAGRRWAAYSWLAKPACFDTPGWIWDAIVWAAHVGYMSGHEVLLTVRFDPSVGYRLTVPRQVAGPAHVVYRPTSDAILEIHSHGPHAADFSATDDADEQGFRLYGVVGLLGTERPEVALRVGAYGHFLAVP